MDDSLRVVVLGVAVTYDKDLDDALKILAGAMVSVLLSSGSYGELAQGTWVLMRIAQHLRTLPTGKPGSVELDCPPQEQAA